MKLFESANNKGRTPVWASARWGYTETVKVLADMCADVYQATNDGTTPLTMAKYCEHPATVEILLAARRENRRMSIRNLGLALMRKHEREIYTYKQL